MNWNLKFCSDDFSCYYNDPIISALIVGVIVYLVDLYRNRRKTKKKYGRIAGDYLGYGYTERNSLKLKTEPQTEATVSYIKDNLLKVSVSEYPNQNHYKWEGIIALELENYGVVTWKYLRMNNVSLDKYEHKFGIKRIIVNEENGKTSLYLIEDDIINSKEFGKEIFIKK